MPEPKDWRKLIRNNKSAGRLISIPFELINKAGFEAEDDIEGRWTVWRPQEHVLVLELRDKVKKTEGFDY